MYTPYIYVVGNIQSFFSVLTGLQMLFNPANNTIWASGTTMGSAVLGLGMVIGLTMMVLSGFINLRVEFHKIVFILIIFIAVWTIQTEVTAENILTGNSVTVQGIPIGIAYPAAIFSTLGYEAAKEIGEADQSASNPDPSLFTGDYGANYGFAGPLALTFKLRGLYSLFSSYNAPLSNSIEQYVAYCLTPETSELDSGMLKDAPSIASTLFSMTYANNQTSVEVNASDDPTNWTITSCSNANSILSQAWTAFAADGGSQSLGNILKVKTGGTSRQGINYTDASSALQNLYVDTANAGQDFIGNLILNCTVEAGIGESISALSNNPANFSAAALPAYCTTKGAALGRQQAMNAGSASLFDSNMIPMMALLQFLFFALAPLVMVIAAMQGMQGLSVLGKYMVFGAWTESWIPVAQVINDYIQMTTQQMFTAIQAAAAAEHSSAVSAANIPIILTDSANALSMADMMMAATPIVTLILLTGSYFALTQLGSKISGNDVVDKNMSESTPTNGVNTEASAATGVGMVSTGLTGGNMSMTAPLETASFKMGSSVSEAVGQAEASNAAVTQQAAAAAMVTASAINTLTRKGESGISSVNGENSSAGIAYSEMNSAKDQLSRDFKVSQDDATKLGTAISMGLGKNADGKFTDQSIGALASLLNVKLDAKQTSDITNAVNSGVADSAINTLQSGIDASQKAGFDTSFKNSQSQSEAGTLAKSAARAKSISSTLAASRAQLEAATRAANEITTAGGDQTFNAKTLGSIMNTEGYKNQMMALNHARDALNAVAASPEEADRLNQLYDENVEAGLKMGGKGDTLAGWAAITTANQMNSHTQAASFIARLTGQQGLIASTGALSKAVGGTQKVVDANTNLGGNAAAVGGVGTTMGADAGVTGSPDNTSNMVSRLRAISKQAEAQAGVSGMGDYTPGESAEIYADDKAIAESGLGTEQKLDLAKQAGMDPMPISQIKPKINAATKNDQMRITQWLKQHPDEDAAGAAIALGIVGATTVVAASKAAKLAGSAMAPRPPVGTGAGDPPSVSRSTSDALRGASADAGLDATAGAVDAAAGAQGGLDPLNDLAAVGLTSAVVYESMNSGSSNGVAIPSSESPVIQLENNSWIKGSPAKTPAGSQQGQPKISPVQQASDEAAALAETPPLPKLPKK